MNPSRYRKAIVAVLGFALGLLFQLSADGFLGDWGPQVVAFLTALGVYQVPNES